MSESESYCGNVSIAGTSFKWEIEKDNLLGKKVGEFLTSPIFHAFSGKWQAKIFPIGLGEECKNYTSTILELLYSVKPLKLQIMGKVVYGNGIIYKRMDGPSDIVYRHTDVNTWRVRKICQHDSLIKNYLNDSGTIKFTFLYEFVPDDYTRVPEPVTFAQALNNEQYSDVKFAVEGRRICAHKIVLANKSKVFAAMFEHKMKENLKGEVEIKDVEYDVLFELFRYIYTGTVNDIEKIAQSLFVAADKYDLIDLKADCGKYLEENITVDNVQDCLDLADRHDILSLRMKIIEFIKSNANKMAQMPVFRSIMELHPDVVVEVVQCLSAKKPRLE